MLLIYLNFKLEERIFPHVTVLFTVHSFKNLNLWLIFPLVAPGLSSIQPGRFIL
jgi:hypothetical protein